MKQHLFPAEILLPDIPADSPLWKAWATVACDQFTGDRTYWEAAAAIAEGSPSTLRMILPEIYLDEGEIRTPEIWRTMEETLHSGALRPTNGMLYLSRLQSDGRVREGIVGMVDLMEYSYEKGADSLIRATEGTVLDRIPPRLAVRRGAALELPHVMLLIDDPEKTVIEPIGKEADTLPLAYDFDLMLGGGQVTGRWMSGEGIARVQEALNRLISPESARSRYGGNGEKPLLFAVGDGNHSLASAKACFEEIRAEYGDEIAMQHPARYALCEVVNLHSDALCFEPIYRVVFGADREELLSAFRAYAGEERKGISDRTDRFTYLSGEEEGVIELGHPDFGLPVGSLEDFLDGYRKTHPGVTVDYIHGELTVRRLAREGAIGFLFRGMAKDDLFRTVLSDGALPRKTFSMGHAEDKRYYIEARKIR